MKKEKIIEVIIIGLFIVFAIIFAVQLILKLTNHSPTDMQILYIGLSAIMSYLLAMSYKAGLFMGEIKAFMNNTKNNFVRIQGDITRIQEDIIRMQGNINKIYSKIDK